MGTYIYYAQSTISRRKAGSGRGGVKMATDKFEHATFYLTKSQVDDIREMARKNQISRSALVRMIIREFLAKQADNKSQ